MARILIIDSEKPMRDMLHRHLHRHGHSPATASDAQEAFRALLGERFDVVLTDIDMVDFEGLKMLQCMRSDPNTSALPVIVLTATKDEERLRSVRRLGVYSCLAKPVNGRILLTEIRKALERPRRPGPLPEPFYTRPAEEPPSEKRPE